MNPAGNKPRDVRTFDSLATLSNAAAAEIVRLANEALKTRGRFTVALAGGNTPRQTYELLAARYRDAIDWKHTAIVFGDERFVPATNPRSNYRMVREALLSRVPLPHGSVHAVPADAPDPAAAALAYDATLRQVVAADGTSSADASGVESVDLALLGIGPDGHTASLFPGMTELLETTDWARAVPPPTTVEPKVPRITTTLTFLNAARTAMFLVAGKDKRAVVRAILDGAPSAQSYPAALVAPRGRALWMVDRSALPDDRSNA